MTPPCFLLLKDEKPNGGNDLNSQNQGHAQGEAEMLGLVPEGVHTQEASDAAAQGCDQEKCFFRDAPEIFLCLELVHKHKNEACGIDYKEVEKENLDHGTFLSGGKI